MEELITNVSVLNVGDIVVVDGISKDDVCVVSTKYQTDKYPIIIDNRCCRSLGRNDKGVREYVYPEDENSTDADQIVQVGLSSSISGEYSFTEIDNVDQWNIRRISKDHPLYDKNMALKGKIFNGVVNFFGNMFD